MSVCRPPQVFSVCPRGPASPACVAGGVRMAQPPRMAQPSPPCHPPCHYRAAGVRYSEPRVPYRTPATVSIYNGQTSIGRKTVFGVGGLLQNFFCRIWLYAWACLLPPCSRWNSVILTDAMPLALTGCIRWKLNRCPKIESLTMLSSEAPR